MFVSSRLQFWGCHLGQHVVCKARLGVLALGVGATTVVFAQESVGVTGNGWTGDGQSILLPAITVTSATGSGYQVDTQNAPASISVITKEDIEGKSYRDITEALQSVPGLYVNDGPTSKGGTEEISIRGLDAKYTLILVDGKAQGSGQGYYNGFGRGSEFGWLPPMSAIERIEIIRGPMSSLYGSAALGGVINVITKDIQDDWRGEITMDRVIQEDNDSGDRAQSRFFLSGPVIADTLGLSVHGSRFDRGEDDIEGGFQDYSREDVTGELKWTPNDSNEIALEAGYATQDSQGSEDLSGRDSELYRIRRHQSLSHELEWGDRLLTKSYVQHEEMANVTQKAAYERTTAKTSTVIPFDNNVVTLGAHYRIQETRNPARALGKATLERWDIALFAEDEWRITDPFALTAGVRWVKDEHYGSETVPRLYGVYSVTPQLTFAGGVSAGYRTPDLKEGDSDWIEGGGGPSLPGGRDVGNSELKPEESLAYELAARWRGQDGTAASITVYQTDFDNKIEKPNVCPRTSDGNGGYLYNCFFRGDYYQGIWQYQNIGEARVRGVEVSYAMPLGGSAQLDSSYTFTDSEQLSGANKGDPLDDQPKHRANLGLSWNVTDRSKLWSKAMYKGRSNQIGEEDMPSYTIADAGITHDLTPDVVLYGGIYNLFDKEVRTEEYGRVIDGRRYNAGITVKF